MDERLAISTNTGTNAMKGRHTTMARNNRAENAVIRAIDGKAALESSVTAEEMLAVLVAAGLAPADDNIMPIARARKISANVYRELAALNMTIEIYNQTRTPHSIPQIAAAYPYVMKKVAETPAPISIDHSNVLINLSDDEKSALKKLNASILKQRYGGGEVGKD
jgi:hypothetical protein